MESHKNVTLEIPVLLVMVKRSKKKRDRKKQRSSTTLLRQKTVYLKVFLQKVFEITTERSPAKLTATVDGATDLSSKNLPQCEEFHATSLSNLPDYFWW